MKPTVLIAVLIFAFSVAHAEDWTASDGTVYKGVKVLSHDDAFVTIMYEDGGARVPLRLLNANLQKQFGYNAAKAAAAEAAATTQDKRDRQAVIDEENAAAAQKIQQAQAQAQQSEPTAAVAQPSPQAPVATSPVPVAAPPAPAAATSAGTPGTPTKDVDVSANNLKIQDDQQALENVKADIRIAERQGIKDAAADAKHNADDVGNNMSDLIKKRDDLTKEIAELQRQNAVALGSGSPPTQDDIDTLKQKIHDLKSEEETLGDGKASDIGGYADKIKDDIAEQKDLESRLTILERRQVLPPLSQDDVVAIHEQIVQIEADIRQLKRDNSRNGAQYNGQQIGQSETNVRIRDDNDHISDLRKKLSRSPRIRVKLSPDEVAEIQKKISDLQADEAAITREGVSPTGGHVDQVNEDAEQALALEDELQHAVSN